MEKIQFRANIAPIMSGIRTGNDGMRISLDIPESDVPDAVGLIALRNTPLKITVEIDDSIYLLKPMKHKKPAKAKGEFGTYWHEMFAKEFHGLMMLWEVLGISDAFEVKAALHKVFDVDSLSFVSPAEFEAWADRNQLQPLITLSRQAVKEVGAYV